MIWVHRACLSPSIATEAAASALRPALVPGVQQLQPNFPQTGCVNDSAASTASRCFPLAVWYDSLVLYGANLDAYGQPQLTGFILSINLTLVKCEKVMDLDCIQRLGTLGCFYSLFPRKGNASLDAASPPVLAPPPPPLLQEATAGGGGGAGSSHAANIGALVGGIVGGLVLAAAAVLLMWRRRPLERSGCGAGVGPLVDAEKAQSGRRQSSSGHSGNSRSQHRASPPPVPLLSSSGVEGSNSRRGKEAAYELPFREVLAHSALDQDPITRATPLQRHIPLEVQMGPRGASVRPSSAPVMHRRSSVSSGPEGAPAPARGFPSLAESSTVLSAANGTVLVPSGEGPGAGAEPAEEETPGRVTLLPVVLGKGTFGRVVEGVWNEQRVAVKLLNLGLLADEQQQGLQGHAMPEQEQQHRPPAEAHQGRQRHELGLGLPGEGGQAQPPAQAGRQAQGQITENDGRMEELAWHGCTGAPEQQLEAQAQDALGTRPGSLLHLSMGAAAELNSLMAGSSSASACTTPRRPPPAPLAAPAWGLPAAPDGPCQVHDPAMSLAQGCACSPPSAFESAWDQARPGGPARTLWPPGHVMNGETYEAASPSASQLFGLRDNRPGRALGHRADSFQADTGWGSDQERHPALGGRAGACVLLTLGSGADTGTLGTSSQGKSASRGKGPSGGLMDRDDAAAPALDGEGPPRALGSPRRHLLAAVRAAPGGEQGAAADGESPEGGQFRAGHQQARQQPPRERDAARTQDALEAALRRTFLAEVEVLARIEHPNIVRLLAACVKPPQMCLVMERMDTSLDRVLYGRGPDGARKLLPLGTVVHIAMQVCSALAYLHPTIIHRDLKPGNVLLSNIDSPTPTVKLADFGLSRLQSTIRDTRHADAGTASYMAPETLNCCSRAITHHVDMYALGIIVWEMLAGRRPWEGLNVVQIAFTVGMINSRPSLCDLEPRRCPPRLKALIQGCWEADPMRRPAAYEAAKELMLLQSKLTNCDST
ncbi:hypothetical protein HYH03_016404 [Edaphochlamys debaryana]|uniref:Protein kinase domain-containing protein n=1 Tax=Edaphochlamys debaryana TaxID=47281 RepID=A0A835XL87_9CHLO|nr:hypothetical protein HYH03_016404 [Edaphochlamys debaryana]|eukprot:KAG2484838.1 hypothetical protein HYH03_016404 [Edaphochlamys debaryana]